MHAVFGTCLLGGFVATVLLTALGALDAGHAHAGHLNLMTSGRPCSEPPSSAPRWPPSCAPPLHGDAVSTVSMLSAPIRIDVPDEVLSTLERLRCSVAGKPL